MASFSTILSDIGHGLKLFFTGAVTVAKAAEPVVDILFPGVSVLYNTTVILLERQETAQTTVLWLPWTLPAIRSSQLLSAGHGQQRAAHHFLLRIRLLPWHWKRLSAPA